MARESTMPQLEGYADWIHQTIAFTTMAMGMLADEGRLNWDVPVRQDVPSFKLYDCVATERLTPRDLVTHRSGLPRARYGVVPHAAYAGGALAAAPILAANKDICTEWQYQNLMYMAANESGDAASEVKDEADRVSNTHPSHPLDAYRGEFEHPGLWHTAL